MKNYLNLLVILTALAIPQGKAQSFVPDSTFNGNGQVLTPKRGLSTQALNVIQQPDGKLLVGGQVKLPHPFWAVSSFFLYRLNTNGLVDVLFGDTGKFQTKQNPNVLLQTADMILSMTLQPDNKIILGGAFNDNLALVRLKGNGSIDSTFGTNGFVETDLGVPGETIRSIVLLNDGTIYAGASNGSDFVLIKYKNDGAIDTTFGNNGLVLTDFSLSKDECGTIFVQPDGKILLTGYAWDNLTGYDFALARYNTNGNLDNGFGNGGKVTIDFGTLFDYGYKTHLKKSGNLVITGYTTLGDGKSKYAVAEINSAGVLNSLFGSGGKVVATTNSRDNFSAGSVLLKNDEVLIGGSSSDFAGNSTKPLIMKVNAAGSFDYSLNGTGFVYYRQANETNVQVYDVMAQQDDKIIICGHSDLPSDYRMNAVRFRYVAPVSTTSIPEEIVNEVSVYPNPARVKIFIDGVAGKTLQLVLWNARGEVVLEKSGADYLDVSEIPEGVYFVSIKCEDGSSARRKVVILKN